MERKNGSRHPAGGVVSFLPDFLSLISLGGASDCPVSCPFLFLASSEHSCCECAGALG